MTTRKRAPRKAAPKANEFTPQVVQPKDETRFARLEVADVTELPDADRAKLTQFKPFGEPGKANDNG